MGETNLNERDLAQFLTPREAGHRIGCGDKPIRRAVNAGELPGYQLGTKWVRVYWPEVLAWVRSHRVAPTSHARARLAEVLAREDAGQA